MDIFSERVKRLRERANLKQATLAPLVKTNRSSYSVYENGTTPPVSVIIACAKYFNVSTDYLLGLSNDERPVTDSFTESVDRLAMAAVRHDADPLSSIDFRNLVARLEAYYNVSGTGSYLVVC